jgi:hypothetical protein
MLIQLLHIIAAINAKLGCLIMVHFDVISYQYDDQLLIRVNQKRHLISAMEREPLHGLGYTAALLMSTALR